MSSPSLLMARVVRLRQELPQIEGAIRTLIADTQLMMTLKDNFDARTLLERANQSVIVAGKLKERLSRTLAEANELMRAMPSRPPGPRDSPPPVNVADVSALVRRLPEAMSTLERSLLTFSLESQRRMNAPGRWGELMAEGNSIHVWWSTMNALLEWWRMEKQRQRVK